jgi:P-type Cu+ transporter
MMPNSNAYLDQSEFRDLYCETSLPTRMKFYVEGIRCAKCVGKIESLKSRLSQVDQLEVDLGRQTLHLQLKSPQDSVADVVDQIVSLGYKPIPIPLEQDETKIWNAEARRDLLRLAVAGFCAGQIMMLAFAGYFGDTGELTQTFAWLQFGLYLPVITYVAWPFYQGFVSGLRSRMLSIDGPMAVASSLGFIVSTANLIRGHGSIYFDSLSGFLFLILATRFWQKKSRYEYLKYLRPSALAETLRARKTVKGLDVWMPSKSIQPGDVILVQRGEWVPVDGRLSETEATFDLSILDGESYPRKLQRGFMIRAGSRLLSEEATLVADKAGSQTFLAGLLSNIEIGQKFSTEGTRISDIASQILLGLVLSIAAVLLGLGLYGNFDLYFERALALIILACPCAMAFGTPLAYAFSMRRLQEQGVVLKTPSVLDRINDIKTVFLDKTGTVTESAWHLHHSSEKEISPEWIQIILCLEAQSQHPIAFALRELWKEVKISDDLTVANWIETPSAGVKGLVDGILWDFHSFEGGEQEKYFGLWKDQRLVWYFQLSPALHAGAAEDIRELVQRGLDVKLVSGDSQAQCLRIASELQVDPQNVFFGMSVQAKADLLVQYPNSMMVGDGFNDSLALKQAHVGVAVKGGVDLALRAADVLVLKDGLHGVVELFRISHISQKQILRNLYSALVYNLIGATLAIGGFVNPFIAALLMPASSMLIWGSTWWGTRK